MLETEINRIMEDVLSEVTENRKIHIKKIGTILVEYGLNNIKNIQVVSNKLKRRGIVITNG